MAHRLEQLRPWLSPRRWVPIVVALAALATAAALITRPSPRSPPAGDLHSIVVQPRPFAATLNLAGVIKAGAPLDVVASFDGSVTQVGFSYGDPVVAGQMIVRMDDFEIAQRVRDAQTALLKAEQASSEMAAWNSSPDVSRARRAKQSADLELAETRRKMDETKGLLDRGLVPRSEYDGLVQQARTQQISAAAAQEDFAGAAKRGQGRNRQVVDLDLQSARAKLQDLKQQLATSTVRAPVDGVMIRPPAPSAGEAGVHAGQRMSRGQLIGSIARREALVVEIALNEADAGKVKIGQAAVVSGGGLGPLQLRGKVISVAGEAMPPLNGAGSSVVAARVQLGSAPQNAGPIRIGATANVAITIHDTPLALVVPPQAVEGAPPLGKIVVRDRKSQRDEPRQVTIGAASQYGVEITSGLRAGEIVVWH